MSKQLILGDTQFHIELVRMLEAVAVYNGHWYDND
jgi:hypothetical protein